MKQRQSTNSIAVSLATLTLLAGLSYLPFVYRDAFGELDAYRVANGIINAMATGESLVESRLFNGKISFGYYTLLYLFRPIFENHLALVVTFMNFINAISAILMVIPFFFVVKRYWGTTVAILANGLLIFVPVWWNVSLYGHPMMQPIAIFFTGLALLGYRSQQANSSASASKMALLDISIIIVFSICLTFRLDAVLMFPLITGCLFLEKYHFRTALVRSLSYGFAAVIVFLLLQSVVFGTTTFSPSPEQTPSSDLGRLLYWHHPARIPENIVRALAIFGLACHPLLLGIFILSSIYLQRLPFLH